MKKNLKIAITPEQPLDQVVRELERLGYSDITSRKLPDKDSIVIAFDDGVFIFAMRWAKDINLTTLAELKEME